MRTTPEVTKRYDELIIECAIKVFAEKGYDAASMKDIADEAGVTRGPLYYRYNSKKELYLAALNAYWKDEMEVYRGIFAQDKHIMELIREDMYYCTRDLRSEASYFPSVVFDDEEMEEVNDAIRSIHTELFAIKCAAVTAAVQKGELRQSTDPTSLVNMMFILYEGIRASKLKTKIITTVEQIDEMIEDLLLMISAKYCVPSSRE